MCQKLEHVRRSYLREVQRFADSPHWLNSSADVHRFQYSTGDKTGAGGARLAF